jgi:choline dehydrogenase-like flavoprotein
MINDFREMVDKAIIEADLCVVGAGAAGISIAKSLINSKLKVCLVESGGFEYEVATQSLYKGKNIGFDYAPLEVSRLRYFGGTTNHWGGYCKPFNEIDFLPREWVPYSGWPITKQELEPYYTQAQKLCGVGPYRYKFSDWFQDDLEWNHEKIVSQIWQKSIPALNFGKVYRKELDKAENIQVIIYANVVEILSNDTAQIVTGVKIVSLDPSKTATVHAKAVVLACGGLENPRLLLTSNRVQTLGLGNQNDKVGRFFMEHFQVHVGKLLTLKRSQPLAYYCHHSNKKGTHIRPGLMVSEAAQRQHQILNVGMVMHSNTQLQTEGYLAVKKVLRTLKSGKSLSSLHRDDVINVLTDLDGAASGLYYRLKNTPEPISSNTDIVLEAVLEQAPNPESRVILDTEKDVLGLPRIKLDWRLGDFDKQSTWIATQLAGEEFGRMGLGRLKVEEWFSQEDNKFEEKTFLFGYHHMGTTRMSDTPNNGVVDKNCRVHGLSNLYIAGSSVFTTSGHAVPTLTIVALALRLAEYLQKKVAFKDVSS